MRGKAAAVAAGAGGGSRPVFIGHGDLAFAAASREARRNEVGRGAPL